ncbi:hypothetical protein AVEN_48529-1 [Araneus ventricosus]|uniref:Uncharacterized protein n=1 Tax=Araneus ventricosus TaxID=182803 RepID=A0A4Y2MXL5_ARAVE|nr:hypothetical protein AVEN_48529-1 [Araneus ventricosus]
MSTMVACHPPFSRPRWPSGKVSTSGPEGRGIETRFHRRSAMYVVCCTLISGQTYSRWCGAEFGEGVPAQVSCSSCERGSRIRGQSLNNPRVASKTGR